MRWLSWVSVCLLSAGVGLVAGFVVDGPSHVILTVALLLLGAAGLYIVRTRRSSD
jgi:drug/metabolite transporter (DMT)-like permease